MNRYLCALLFFPLIILAEGNDALEKASQHELKGEYELAAKSYQLAIEKITAKYGEFSIHLFEPLLGKGRTLSTLDESDKATELLEHALHILRRNEGVYTLRQLEVVDELTRMAMLIDQPLKADKQQIFSHFISKRFYGESNPEILASAYKLMKWHIDTGQFTKALNLANNALENMQEHGLGNDPRLIGVHLLAAKVRRLKGICCSEKRLGDVIESLEQNTDLPMDVTNEVYLSLADAYVVSKKPEEARNYYAKADIADSAPTPIAMSALLDPVRQHHTRMYRPEDGPYGTSLVRMTREEQLSAGEQPPQQFFVPLDDHKYDIKIVDSVAGIRSREKTKAIIGEPFLFYYDQVKDLVPRLFKGDDSQKKIKITLVFTVKSDGSLENIEITETNAPTKLNRLMEQAMTKVIYRPALARGVPITKKNVSVIQTFINNHET